MNPGRTRTVKECSIIGNESTTASAGGREKVSLRASISDSAKIPRLEKSTSRHRLSRNSPVTGFQLINASSHCRPALILFTVHTPLADSQESLLPCLYIPGVVFLVDDGSRHLRAWDHSAVGSLDRDICCSGSCDACTIAAMSAGFGL